MLALAESQARAVQHGDGPLLVVGAPGTGKTEALARRFARLVGVGIDPARILVLTSTRATAGRLRQRIEALLEAPYEELWIGTWGELGERLLREHSTAACLDPFFDVLGPAERLAILLDRLDDLPLRNREIRGNPTGLLARLIEQIDELKSGAEPPEPELAELCAAHDRILAERGSLDRADVFLQLAKLLDERPEVLAELGARFVHVMVDEHEDATAAQRSILRALATANPNHLYATSAPVSPADARIETLILEEVLREPVLRRWRCTNERAQAQAVAREVEHLIAGGASPESICVLVRNARFT